MFDILEYKEEVLTGEKRLPAGYQIDYWRPSDSVDTLSLDYETKSDVDITQVGLDVYTMPRNNPRVLMGAYRINRKGKRGPLEHWQAHHGPPPAELVDALEDPAVEKWAFNASFERVVTNRVLRINSPIKNWRCTMSLAYMHSFPGGLDDIGAAIGLPLDLQKQKDGKRLIKMFCMPQKITKNQPYEWRNWITDPDDWENFCQYNMQDVVTEESAKARLTSQPFPILADEWVFYELDQLINDRGMPADPLFINNVIRMSDRRKRELIDEMIEITELDNPNSGYQLLPWLRERGYPYDNLQKENIEKALNRSKELWNQKKDVPDSEAKPVIRLLRRRQWSAVRAIDKAFAARKMMGEGGVVRYMYKFCGAQRTARFSGAGVQPQNMKRTPKMLDPEEDDEKLTIATEIIRAGDYDGFDLFINEPLEAMTGCMRGMFRAPDGYELKACDYKSVESAGLGWAAGCTRLLDVFREGRDAYLDFGTLFYNKPYDKVTRAERQICKPPALGCGYRLSAGEIIDGVKSGLLAYADNMGVEMTQEQATHAVKVFREGYPEIPVFWKNCEIAVEYVLRTGQPYQLGFFRFEWMKPYMLIRLPSGRCIYYYKPKLETRLVRTGKYKTVRSRGWELDGAAYGELINTEIIYWQKNYSYMGRNQRTTKFERILAHGGVTTENLVQALTRDILKVGLTRLHKAGFDLRGHAHDEGIVLQRIGDTRFTLDLMRQIYREPIDWAPGFPLDASGWSGKFYRKA